MPKATVTERKIADIIPRKLALIQRFRETADGRISSVYRARIWQPEIKRYAHLNLAARDEFDAREKAIERYSSLLNDIKNGRDVGFKHRNLQYYIDEFLKLQTQRGADGQITVKRVRVIEHHLASLIRFYEEEKKPKLDELTRLYENKWQDWRSKQKVKLTGKTLSARFRNNELNSHKMFFRWAERNRHLSRLPTIEGLKVKRTNEPFPTEFYQKLLRVSRENIQDATNFRIGWELMNYRYVILLMSGIGCRVAECKNLQWKDIDRRKTGIYLYLHGKDKERTIQIPERVYGHLMDLHKWKVSKVPNYTAEDYPHIFNTYKSPKASNHFAGGVRRRWMKEAGVPNPNDYELVCFRHRFITDALNGGAHSLTIANYCGTSQKMIENTYSGLVATQVYDLVFKNSPDDALSRNETPKWLENLVK
jgi:integrase